MKWNKIPPLPSPIQQYSIIPSDLSTSCTEREMEKICVAVRVRPPVKSSLSLSEDSNGSHWKVDQNRISLHRSLPGTPLPPSLSYTFGIHYYFFPIFFLYVTFFPFKYNIILNNELWFICRSCFRPRLLKFKRLWPPHQGYYSCRSSRFQWYSTLYFSSSFIPNLFTKFKHFSFS